MIQEVVLILCALLTSQSSSFSPRLGKCLPILKGSCNSQRHHINHTTIATSNHEDEELRRQDEENNLKCQGCEVTFESRNALFRHLRGEDDASMECSIAMQARPLLEDELLMSTVIRYGYYGDIILQLDDADASAVTNTATNELVANMIQNAFVQHANAFLGDQHDFEQATTALSYSTATIMRQPSLRQESDVVGAVSEVLSFNYRLRCKPETMIMWKEYANSGRIQEHVQILLDRESSIVQVQLHQMDALVPRSYKFYAERSATQRSYSFLLPITWILSDIECSVENVIEWHKHISQRSRAVRLHLPRAAGVGKSNPAPAFISKLKQSLKAAESETVPNRRVRRQMYHDGAAFDEVGNNNDSATRLSHGRFGQLWRKEKRCWSNFAHSSLTGMASSPGFEAMWRTIDRAQIVGVVDLKSSDNADIEHASKGANNAIQNMHIILVFKADGFVMGQIPRMISALVAMTNGWLPPNFFEIATRPDVRIPELPAPTCLYKRLYFQSARYHFHELTSNANGRGESSSESFAKTVQPGVSESEQKWEDLIRQKLLEGSPLTSSQDEEEWLRELRDDICPEIRRHIEVVEAENLAAKHQLDSEQESRTTLPIVETDAPIGAYSKTLELLRDIAENGKWPATSDARSRVIKSPGIVSGNFLTTKKKSLVSKFPGQTISSGSFTVINEGLWWNNELPLGNSLFPELTMAVFDLEEEVIRLTSPPIPSAEGMKRRLSSSRHRTPSTHCAVNRNGKHL